MAKTVVKTDALAVIRLLCEAEMIHYETALLVQSMSETPDNASAALPPRPTRDTAER
jgi:hypothetical protein